MSRSVFILLVVVILSGCARHLPPVEYQNPTVIPKPEFEIAWVDPQIVLSDSLITLIRSEKIDSIYIDHNQPPKNNGIKTTKAFQILRDNCFTMIRLVNTRGEARYILLEETLQKGYYQISLNKVKINDPFLFLKDTFIKIDYCGTSIVEPVEF